MSETHIELEIMAWKRMIEEIEEKKRHCINKMNILKDELRFIRIVKENPERREMFKNLIDHIAEMEQSNVDDDFPA